VVWIEAGRPAALKLTDRGAQNLDALGRSGRPVHFVTDYRHRPLCGRSKIRHPCAAAAELGAAVRLEVCRGRALRLEVELCAAPPVSFVALHGAR